LRRTPDAEFSPPHGPVRIGLEELIQILAKNIRPAKFSERRIQVRGRRLKKFVPQFGV
jgi:hypothetical protein